MSSVVQVSSARSSTPVANSLSFKFRNQSHSANPIFLSRFLFLFLFFFFFFTRLLIKNGNSIDAAALYDSYEVEYLPNEGLLSKSRYLFIELTTDAAGTSTGFAVRYQGE